VELLGHVDDVAHELKQADIFLQTSHFEGMPNALIEALAAGLPVVSTSCGGSVRRCLVPAAAAGAGRQAAAPGGAAGAAGAAAPRAAGRERRAAGQHPGRPGGAAAGAVPLLPWR
jgi:glycosyltransferase involved in cell wall biosynthesis